ncbi:hypothetical protein MF271_15455 [Deinococcus sp. KNUC1210]|uniref:hypothetical protein n=1 Tax=Deinococcus sp. KNUC1210 TaxID=2917691 RepID=UPI001EF12217|nr:hypothetical protein [Deinococcus sp. KNUC1210]ULH15321.1 hypothetical protein MF271_15455 [Deinococcus sp. KNUC1210]
MKRLLVAASLLLGACAPVMQGDTSVQRAPKPALQASFSPAGVIWLEGGQVWLARSPGFQKVNLRLPGPASAVAWQAVTNDFTPWAALTAAGLIVTADARPVSVPVGRVVAMSSSRVYREDGSAVGFDGSAAAVGSAGLLGAPDTVLTGSDGLDYALQGSRLYRVDGSAAPTLLTTGAAPFLYAAAAGEFGGVGTANAPTLVTSTGRYVLTGAALERRDAAGALLASVPHGAGVLGAVGSLIVTVQPGGKLRVFAPELRELTP